MPAKRDEQEEEPKIKVVDRRMLSEDERAGKGPAGGEAPAAAAPTATPATVATAAPTAAPTAAQGAVPNGPATAGPEAAELDRPVGLDGAAAEDEDDDRPLTEEEANQLRSEMESQQFEAIEKQMGRPLTEQEKDAVRVEMDRQVQAATSLEVTPVLMELLSSLSRMAVVHLGLMPNPYTRLVARNDTQARLAIDSMTAIYDVVKGQLDPASQREFQRVLNDLRVNFVNITGTPAGTGSGGRIIH